MPLDRGAERSAHRAGVPADRALWGGAAGSSRRCCAADAGHFFHAGLALRRRCGAVVRHPAGLLRALARRRVASGCGRLRPGAGDQAQRALLPAAIGRTTWWVVGRRAGRSRPWARPARRRTSAVLLGKVRPWRWSRWRRRAAGPVRAVALAVVRHRDATSATGSASTPTTSTTTSSTSAANWNHPPFPWHVALVGPRSSRCRRPWGAAWAGHVVTRAGRAACRRRAGAGPAPRCCRPRSAMGRSSSAPTPIFGAEKHWAPAMPTLCIAGRGRRGGGPLRAWPARWLGPCRRARPAPAARVALAALVGAPRTRRSPRSPMRSRTTTRWPAAPPAAPTSA